MTERMFTATPIIGSDLDSPEQALQGVIRRIRLAHLSDVQQGFQARIASSQGSARDDIELEHLRVGMIIGHLRDVKRKWDDIAPLLRLH